MDGEFLLQNAFAPVFSEGNLIDYHPACCSDSGRASCMRSECPRQPAGAPNNKAVACFKQQSGREASSRSFCCLVGNELLNMFPCLNGQELLST